MRIEGRGRRRVLCSPQLPNLSPRLKTRSPPSVSARAAATRGYTQRCDFITDRGLFDGLPAPRPKSGGRSILLPSQEQQSPCRRRRAGDSTRILRLERLRLGGLFAPKMKSILVLVSQRRLGRGDQFHDQSRRNQRHCNKQKGHHAARISSRSATGFTARKCQPLDPRMSYFGHACWRAGQKQVVTFGTSAKSSPAETSRSNHEKAFLAC